MTTGSPEDPDGSTVLMSIVEERTEPQPDGKQDVKSNVWTSRRRLRQDGHKGKSALDRDEVDGVVDELVEAGDIFEWHGLLAPATEDHLRAIVANENQAEVPRSILVDQVREQMKGVPA